MISRHCWALRAMLALFFVWLALGGSPASAAAPAPAPPRPGGVQKKASAVKPPFTFRIQVNNLDGKPQPGVKIHVRHPRQGRGGPKPIVNFNAVSDAQGVATFKVGKGDLELDRYYWFNIADPNFTGDSGVGISPVDNEYEYTFKVAPASQYQARVTDEAGKPIAGAGLWILNDYPNFPIINSNDMFRAMASAKTTTEGLAQFKMADVKVNIVTRAPGYAADFARGVSLAKDKPVEIRLGRGLTVTGRIADDAGKPVTSATVTAKRKEFVMDYIDDFILKGVTDAEGRFELKGALAAPYTVSAQVADAGKALTIDPADVTVEAGTPAKVELKARQGTLIKGRYVTNHKLPLADRTIFINVYQPENRNWQTKTAKDGTFAITLPPGTRGSIDFIGVSGYTNAPKIPENIKFMAAQRRDIQFENPPPGVFEGIEIEFTKEARVSGTIKDASGKPLTDAEVQLVARPNGSIIRPDKNGKFSVGVGAGAQVWLEVFPAKNLNRPIYKAPPFQAGEDEDVTQEIVVPGDLMPKPVDEFISLLGVVVGEDGKPAAGARVVLANNSVIMEERQGAATWQDGNLRPPYLAANAKGEFSFTSLKRGKTDIWAEHPQLGAGWIPGVATDAYDVKIVLHPVSKTIAYRGRVTGPDGKPVAGARLELLMERNAERTIQGQATSDAQGNFELKAGLKFSPLMTSLALVCVPPQGAAAWRNVPPCPCEGLEMKLKPAGQVAGRVVDKLGKPIPGATVIFYSGKDPDYGSIFFLGIDSILPRAQTDADGRYTLGQAPAGSTISLQGRHPERARDYAWNIPIVAGPNPAEDIALPGGVTVGGTVRFAGTGKPAAGITVKLNNLGSDDPQAVTDAKGHYEIRGLTTYGSPISLLAQDRPTTPTWVGQEKTGQVNPGDNVTLDITLRESIESRQPAWRKEKAQAPAGAGEALIMEVLPPRGDRLSYEINTLRVDGAGNVKQSASVTTNTMAMNLPLAWDGVNKRMWWREESSQSRPGGYLIKDLEGKVYGRAASGRDDLYLGTLAIDPKTGMAWVLTSKQTIYGEDVRVFNAKGEMVTSHTLAGSTIFYSARDDCFWIAGKKLFKVNREGKKIFEYPKEAPWLFGCGGICPWDGSAWVFEHSHPNVAGKFKLMILEPDGKLRRTIDMPEDSGGHLAFDEKNRVAWLGTADGIWKLSPEGEKLATIPLYTLGITAEQDTGCVWVTGRWGVYRLDPQGRLAWSREEPPGEGREYWPWRQVVLIPSQ